MLLLLPRQACRALTAFGALSSSSLSNIHHRAQRLLLHCSPSNTIMASSSSSSSANQGIMMILSPAKTLDLTPYNSNDDDNNDNHLTLTNPDCDIAKTQQVAKAMKKRKQGELAKLLGISANLAQTAAGYWKDFDADTPTTDTPTTNSITITTKPCIYAFSGAAYQGLQIHDCSPEAVAYMQKCLRIIDPLYGCLRPLDRIQPYRLEMATRGVFSNDDDDDKKKTVKLANFWSDSVTERISKELQSFSTPILLNLASDEYSAVIDADKLLQHNDDHGEHDEQKVPLFVKVVFRENGRVIAVHAKRARGLMVRYLSERQASILDHVRQFAEEGYAFQEEESNDTTLVFDREKQPAASKRKLAAKKSKTATATNTTSTRKKSKR